ncbi:hypothetical protein M3Y96_00718200 [Aphelenchoides besseyi]|nr:hypothetical protein M3Y96_00718200 [Aphelenchoides besseyi]
MAFTLQIRSIAILIAGVVAFMWTGQGFYPFACFGGTTWTAACLIILPVINEIGLCVAVLLYSFSNCLTQWFTGNYGLFMTTTRTPIPAKST